MPTPIEKIIFMAASSLADPEDRHILLDRACGGDSAMRRRIEGIFEVQEVAADFFESEPEIPPVNPGVEGDEGVGGRIGRYRLIERIGSGGHGAVYLAEQIEPVRRKVALKVIRLGMDTEKVIARFELERQALAMMDHPNIARVLDAGATASGRPFFVMELVDGERITTFCNAKRLGVRQRLELFIQVCHALQHAHQKGVIHRDIKPSNILVRERDGALVSKVIDFGIAKAATKGPEDHETLTAADEPVGTPAYMSPEMAKGGFDVDTRSDIHSLGAVLYEILTDHPPFDPKRLRTHGMEEIRKILCEEDPPPPSGLFASLPKEELDRIAALRGMDSSKLLQRARGDLDWIVMKSLERDRNRRYGTASGLAADIERHLRHEPVTAGPPGRLYRLSKLVHRNKIPFLFGGTVFLLLASGFGASTYLFLREKDARTQQERLKAEADMARDNEAGLRRMAEYRDLVSQAAVQVSYKHLKEADEILAKVPVELTPPSLEAARAYTTVGEWHVMDGRWRVATDRFSAAALSLATVDPSDSDAISINLIPAAATLSLSGDRARYDKLRTMAIERFKNTTHPLIAEQIVKSSLLMPADEVIHNALDPMADFLMTSINERHQELTKDPNRVAWATFALALLNYREGKLQTAADWSARCLSYEGSVPSRDASTRCLLTMIRWSQGKRDESRKLLIEARQSIETAFSKKLEIGNYRSFWFDWVNARLLLREAETLVNGG